MVVAVSVLILSYSEGKPVTENKAYARCASIKATNVPKLILILAKLVFARFYEAWFRILKLLYVEASHHWQIPTFGLSPWVTSMKLDYC